MTQEDVLTVEDRGAVRILTLNRPHRRNALNTALTAAILARLDEADQDDAVRAVVLAGAGRGFCAGADINEFSDLTPDRADLIERRAEMSHRMYSRFRQLRKPIVSAVHGAAVGGGGALAIACDMTVAAEDLKIGFPEINHSILPALIMPILQRQIPTKIAFELISSGRLMSAQEARSLHLVNRIVPVEAVLDAALEVAQAWAAASRPALEALKTLFYRTDDLTFAEAMIEGRAANVRMRSYRMPEAKDPAQGSMP